MKWSNSGLGLFFNTFSLGLSLSVYKEGLCWINIFTFVVCIFDIGKCCLYGHLEVSESMDRRRIHNRNRKRRGI